jgi:DNA-binding NtrC family response regulator
MTEPTLFLRERTILVVDTRAAVLRRTGDALRRAGYEIFEADSFGDAKRILLSRKPAVLISGLRLAAFNGLHLVHLARLTRPDLNAIIISASADAILQTEAERVGASLLVEPVPPLTLLSVISRMLDDDRGSELPLAFDRRHADRRSTVRVAGVAPERRKVDRRISVVVPVLQRDRSLT